MERCYSPHHPLFRTVLAGVQPELAACAADAKSFGGRLGPTTPPGGGNYGRFATMAPAECRRMAGVFQKGSDYALFRDRAVEWEVHKAKGKSRAIGSEQDVTTSRLRPSPSTQDATSICRASS